MRTLRVAAFQFAADSDIDRNVAALERGMRGAAERGARLVVTQECGLCGYPPLERDGTATLDQNKQRAALDYLAGLASRLGVYLVVGFITPAGDSFTNALALIHPDGKVGAPYQKRALWGWDAENFVPGQSAGIHDVDGLKVGLRLCFEVRFPEYFRELFSEGGDLAIVGLCNVGDTPDSGRDSVYRSHLISRASENAMWVISANSCSRPQLAPSCLIDPNGRVVAECSPNQEDLLCADIALTEPGFGAKGRIAISRILTGAGSGSAGPSASQTPVEG